MQFAYDNDIIYACLSTRRRYVVEPFHFRNIEFATSSELLRLRDGVIVNGINFRQPCFKNSSEKRRIRMHNLVVEMRCCFICNVAN